MGESKSQSLWLDAFIEDHKDDEEFELEQFILEITEIISKKLKDKQMNRTILAQQLGSSPANISKLLNGTNNFTLKTLFKVAKILDLEFTTPLKEKTPKTDRESMHTVAYKVENSMFKNVNSEEGIVSGRIVSAEYEMKNELNLISTTEICE